MIMNEIKKVKEVIDKSRLLFAISVSWVIVASLLYFSNVDQTSCHSRDVSVGSSLPGWMILWYQLTLGYVELYKTEYSGFVSGASICSQTEFNYLGYFAFVALPILLTIIVTIVTKWVRRA